MSSRDGPGMPSDLAWPQLPVIEETVSSARRGGEAWPQAANPLADGHAADRAVRHLAAHLERRAS